MTPHAYHRTPTSPFVADSQAKRHRQLTFVTIVGFAAAAGVALR